jgi:hypothetical protein
MTKLTESIFNDADANNNNNNIRESKRAKMDSSNKNDDQLNHNNLDISVNEIDLNENENDDETIQQSKLLWDPTNTRIEQATKLKQFQASIEAKFNIKFGLFYFNF